jgi:serine protease Do
MQLKKVALAGVALALAGTIPLSLAHEAPPPHARAYAYHFGESGSWLGVSIEDIDKERSAELGLEREMGAEVKDVQPGSPAEEAGIQPGDVILRYQGTPIEGVRQLIRLVRETPSGRTVAIELFRNGSTMDLEATVSERDEDWSSRFDMEGIEIPDIEVPDVEIHGFGIPCGRCPARIGASVDDLTEQLGEYFGVEDGKGVLVREVEKDSPGGNAGLRAGDVIVRVDDDRITDTRELRRAVRVRRDQELELTVIRKGKEKILTLEVPEEAVSSTMPHRVRTIGLKTL